MKTEADRNGADSPYLRYVQKHSHRHPSLKLLRDLPEVPQHPTRIKILEFRGDGVDNVDFNKVAQLEAYWSATAAASTDCKGRLYLVEDISLPYISSFGLRFNIDPRFFVEYLNFDPDRNQNFLSGYHPMRRLTSLRNQTDFATFVYHEIRAFSGTAPRREDYEIRTMTNVPRLLTTVDHHSGRFTGLVRRNLSVWRRPSQGNDKPWDVVILADPAASDRFTIRNWKKMAWTSISCQSSPYLEGYLDFTSWPPPQEDVSLPDYPSQHRSMLDDIARYWCGASPLDLKLAEQDPSYSPIFAYRIVAAHWNLQLEYLVPVVSNLEKGLLKFEQMDAHPHAESINNEVSALRVLLSDVNSWRRRVYFYLEQMKWNIEVLGLPHGGVMERIIGMDEEECEEKVPHPCRDPRKRQERDANMLAATDFHAILISLRLTQQRIQSLLPVVMGAFSLLEAQHSVLKADLTIRLTSVALVFVPLSFTASVLSMSEDFIPGKRLFWVYFVVSAPMIIALFWWAYWVQLGSLKRRMAGKFWRAKLGREAKED
ncbi:hypothetical protein BU26DRAFT_57681 [Trematosphaeria pertusa]|uniref:Cora-domain-containing protein n=1 Tax=Trematosphaeria pertusa TaxID=390896 RepID=A0A6A6I6C2_9PLEO|nr:uncharacterized protein BU26DRAFT_57681 [Trematosphaeria pertusa]KAF2245866.1 hypothetical protein BU26DRAFT_57681 [Trematosphaeria pertusa]